MKRRDFLKTAAPAALLPLMLGGYSVKAFANSRFFHALAASGVPSDRVLVLIQFIGGNDGLQTIIPLDQYSEIMAARSNIAIPEANVLKLTSTVGMNPVMTGMQSLYQQGKLGIIQGVGYPTPNFSHFRSTDIWLTGSDYNQTLATGWLGRYLDQEYPGYPTGYPNATISDPVGIQIGSSISLGFEGKDSNMGMAFANPSAFYDIVNDTSDATPNTRGGHELSYVRSVGAQLQSFGAPVVAAAKKGVTKSQQWPTAATNALADQLRIVAQLIAGGLKTKIYVVSLGGFDSHTDQRNGQDARLTRVSNAITAFQDELKLNALEDRVLGMTFSEFGRRVKSNDSLGTDHGAASCMFVFGSKVQPGILGANPVLPKIATFDDNVSMQYDFRSVYASVLREWFGASDTELTNTLLKLYPTLPIIQTSGVERPTPLASIELLQNYPNPFGAASGSHSTQINFTTNGGHASLRVYDTKGSLITTLIDNQVPSGARTISFDGSELPSGTYFYRLEANGTTLTKPMVLTR